MTRARYSVLMLNVEAGASAAHESDRRRPAEGVARRAERAEDVVAGVVGYRGGPGVDR